MIDIQYEDRNKVKPRIKHLMQLLKDRRGLVDRLNVKDALYNMVGYAFGKGYITSEDTSRYMGQARRVLA